mmetsp:Transcript_29692/g.43886  ORF Transcript_29692/g.43886 Transcript_29692/m.43886 type:complete len:293 (+) Transcript_29692:606-1484(+)|eukprot:CAMPEP_0194250530 /NCGR_PEP_ID=MMETSP0158-20130606/23270_1 /TAXON_ID=33649 /ORGANISM="Thalassionema nitzschioides, Strain L26-B" /LENGTH=292 /DNA_ID=CAMNT_0038987367 /DNA_START=565 /DNA_END=1443 /DNA_ORIENTATION=-
MTTVLLLVGLPGSGKSFLARRLCELVDTSTSIHVEYDKVAESLSKTNDDLAAWRKSRGLALEMFESHLDKKTELIIMDDNMHLRSMRKGIYRQCQERVHNGSSVYFGIIVVNTPLSVCLERNQTRDADRFVPVDVIQNMSNTMEPPDPQKASWEANHIRIGGTSNDASLEASRDWITSLQDNPVPSPPPEVDQELLEQERQSTRKCLLHQYDMSMRKWVGIVAKIAMGKEVNAKVASANRARKELLVELRSRDDDTTLEILIDQFCLRVGHGWDEQEMQLLHDNLTKTIKEL